MKLLMNRQGLPMKFIPHQELMKPPHQVVIPDDGVEDPLSYKQAMNDVDKDQWVKAIDLEMESMYFNSV
ncbi:gag/pol protein [Cucumis melo var. makuwa]|uniref:Gag/pol protein n=1 Tax=Cucumis melo var. makuwa TaxID=1194695 RepID=A0A5D3DR32_CUCMM|nr:gag/pol protein [Cucumis melo var. makuwa]TYK26044.1 gag/pol protein [Cucumis melo var. makuwa]